MGASPTTITCNDRRRIACGVSVAVIDALEMVDIEEQGECAAGAGMNGSGNQIEIPKEVDPVPGASILKPAAGHSSVAASSRLWLADRSFAKFVYQVQILRMSSKLCPRRRTLVRARRTLVCRHLV